MNALLTFLTSLLPTLESQHDRDEAYLAQALDIYDLERRMREIDKRGRRHASPVALGLYTR